MLSGIFVNNQKCLLNTSSWPEASQALKIVEINPIIKVAPFADHFNQTAPKEIPSSELKHLFPSPFHYLTRLNDNTWCQIGYLINDVASSIIAKNDGIELIELIARIQKSELGSHVHATLIEICLKFAVVNNHFTTTLKRKNQCFSIGEAQRRAERERAFAGSFASELSALSERVRLIVRHSGTVGTYRENIFQNLLRKALPERYHVATGFIHGSDRQLDVIIYDKIDYAPLFREGDLVVVPAQSVRAVIEVKTGIDKAQLTSSLELLQSISDLDDASPPFFKGIFAFEANLLEESIYKVIVDCYSLEIEEANLDIESDFELGMFISEPYKHFSCLCVLNTAFAAVEYSSDDDGRLIPHLVRYGSATGNMLHAALFFETLLAYLRTETLKSDRSHRFKNMLGTDITRDVMGRLVRMDDWGPYFDVAYGDDDLADEKLLAAEENYRAVAAWLNGAAYRKPNGPSTPQAY